MAYDPKRARGHRAPAPAAEHEEVPAPVDGLLDGRIEHPAELDEPLPSASAEDAADAVPVADAPAEPAPEPEPAAAPTAAAPAPATPPVPSEPPVTPVPSEPPVAPVPETAGSRWIFFAFLAAVVALIVWRLRRRTR